MDINQGGQIMKGYNTESGFMGYVDGTYILYGNGQYAEKGV